MVSNATKRLLPGGNLELAFATLLLYIIFSVFLFRPYLTNLSDYQFFNFIDPIFAAWGAYFLSRRWINNWTPSLLAGAIYGFSPFALSFASYPVAGLSYMMVPWLFLPSAYWHKNNPADTVRFFVRCLFALLPFAGITLLFWVTSQKWALNGPHFLMPIHAQLTPKHFCDLVFPLYGMGDHLTFGIYHAPLILVIMGIFVLVTLQRLSVVVPIAAAMMLCFMEPMLQVPPIVWAAVPVLFLAVLAGVGFQAILLSSRSDTKWVLACAVAASVAAAFFGGAAYKRLIVGSLLEWAALMYALAAAGLWLVLFFAKTGHRWSWSRWIILTAVTAIDLVLSARWLVDKLF